MPGKQARALCPVCREAMPPDETECQNCGAFVIDEAVVRLCRAFGIDREKALQLFEAGFRHPTDLRGREIKDVLERRESGLLFICTNCGSFVATGDAKCPRCSAEFEAGEEEEPVEAEEEDILDLVLCPNCGADNGADEAECEICGEALEPAEAARSVAEVPRAETQERPRPERGYDELEKVDLLLDDLEPTKIDERGTPPSPPRTTPHPPATAQRPAPQEPTKHLPLRTVKSEARKFVPTPGPSPSRSALRPVPSARAVPQQVAKATVREAAPPPSRTTADAETTPRRIKRPMEIGAMRPRRVRAIQKKTRAWPSPPPEHTGAAVVASAIGLYASRAMGRSDAAWAIAFALAAFSGYAVAASYPTRTIRLHRFDVLLLAVGASLGWIALFLDSWLPGPTMDIVSLVTFAGAVPLAWATRRIVGGPARALLAAAGGIPLIALAVAVGENLGLATGPVWDLGFLAAVPWPVALTAAELRSRYLARATRKQLAEAERDYARQDYTKSLEDYDRAIVLSEKGSGRPDLPWYGKGATLVLLGQYEEALRAIDRALDINPRNEVAWVNKGNALTKMGRLVDALRCFNAAIKVNPRYEVAWNNKGNALARLGRYEDALRCYEKALEIDAAYRGAWVNKGYVLAKLGRFDEATACADHVLRLAAADRLRLA